jgi:hypothetical protein
MKEHQPLASRLSGPRAEHRPPDGGVDPPHSTIRSPIFIGCIGESSYPLGSSLYSKETFGARTYCSSQRRPLPRHILSGHAPRCAHVHCASDDSTSYVRVSQYEPGDIVKRRSDYEPGDDAFYEPESSVIQRIDNRPTATTRGARRSRLQARPPSSILRKWERNGQKIEQQTSHLQGSTSDALVTDNAPPPHASSNLGSLTAGNKAGGGAAQQTRLQGSSCDTPCANSRALGEESFPPVPCADTFSSAHHYGASVPHVSSILGSPTAGNKANSHGLGEQKATLYNMPADMSQLLQYLNARGHACFGQGSDNPPNLLGPLQVEAVGLSRSSIHKNVYTVSCLFMPHLIYACDLVRGGPGSNNPPNLLSEVPYMIQDIGYICPETFGHIQTSSLEILCGKQLPSIANNLMPLSSLDEVHQCGGRQDG